MVKQDPPEESPKDDAKGGEEGKRIDFKSLYCPHELDQVTYKDSWD